MCACVCLPACPQVLVVTMIKSLPMLFDVLLLALFHFSLFTIITLNIFAGKFAFRCVGCGPCKQACTCALEACLGKPSLASSSWYGMDLHRAPPA